MRSFFPRWVALFLAILIFPGNLSVPAYPGEHHLSGLFHWAKKNYLEGNYKAAADNLESVLTFLGDENRDRELLGKVYLLLGAACEKQGNIPGARENFNRAAQILEEPVIEDIPLASFVEYQRIIMGNRDPVRENVIQKEAPKPKRKKISLLAAAAGLLVAAGITVILLGKKKRKPTSSEDIWVDPLEEEYDPDFDTEVLGIEWVRIPAGEFLMGDNFNEGEGDERPVHAVYLSEYYISKYEITFEQYDLFCQQTSRGRAPDEGWGRGKNPAINVSFSNCQNFCNWLHRKTRKNYYLPSEAQWEKAARGTDQRRYPWGNSPPDCSKANHCCRTGTRPVGSHPAGVSPYGIHDMAGNAFEWCRDGYHEDFYSVSPYTDPIGPTNTGPGTLNYDRVIRGGSWACGDDSDVRAAARSFKSIDYGTQDDIFPDLGFRIVMEK